MRAPIRDWFVSPPPGCLLWKFALVYEHLRGVTPGLLFGVTFSILFVVAQDWICDFSHWCFVLRAVELSCTTRSAQLVAPDEAVFGIFFARCMSQDRLRRFAVPIAALPSQLLQYVAS